MQTVRATAAGYSGYHARIQSDDEPVLRQRGVLAPERAPAGDCGEPVLIL